MPPQIDENDLRGSLTRMHDYLFYLREQMIYELNLIKKQNGGSEDVL